MQSSASKLSMAALRDDPAMLPSSNSARSSAGADPAQMDALARQTAQRISDVINCFEPEFYKRHGSWPISTACFEFGLQAHAYKLVPVPVPGEHAPITVHAGRKPHPGAPVPATIAPPVHHPVRHASGAEPDPVSVSCQTRQSLIPIQATSSRNGGANYPLATPEQQTTERASSPFAHRNPNPTNKV